MIRRLFMLMLCLALFVAACGDDAEDDGADASGDTAEDTDDDGDGDGDGDDDSTEGDEGADAGSDWPDSLVLTLQPAENATELIQSAEPLAGFLSDRLGIEVVAQVPNDYQGVIVALASGQADIGGGFGPVNVARAMDQAGAEPILQAERFGEFLYVSQWFTNDPGTFCADDPVEETYEEDGQEYTLRFCNGVNELATSEEGPVGLENLEHVGDVPISFVAEGSASGQVFPAYGLIEAGYDLSELETFFAGGHPESVQAVYNGDATVGVSYNDAREDLVAEIADVGEEVVVFAWSAPIPNDAFVVRGDLPDDLKQAITEALLDIAQDPEEGEVLLDLYNIDGFREADPSDFDNARQVDAELGELLD
jgi:phosphonate transport system substrate-binding protein